MTAEAERISYRSGGPQAKRRIRNYLLVPSFQLKYTAMVVGVTVIVATVLGILAYNYSTGQTQLLTINKMEAKGGAIDEQFMKDLQRYGEEADRKVALSIVGSVLFLALALAITGILVTHRLVGPAFRLKALLREVRDGHLRVEGRLRKHDELQDLFEAFQQMIFSLRAAQEKEIALLEAAIERAKLAGFPVEAIADLESVRERMRAALD
ncbi:MAG TPA: HAMP domain-containing protein [Polyangiales bacterium]|jgi:nitrogen fixation/metabolism regulation signal transduction histidine kinase|nr:HAMP domain-containing protein [Polyangiales bacterium]